MSIFANPNLNNIVMETISSKKVVISYVLTSVVIFTISAITSALGLLGNGAGSFSGTLSTELLAFIHLFIVLAANGVLHGLFYYGGLESAPIIKGISIGMCLGLGYFLIAVFAFNSYDINSDSITLLLSAISSKVFEYSVGGVLTAVISVSEIHKWGLLRAI